MRDSGLRLNVAWRKAVAGHERHRHAAATDAARVVELVVAAAPRTNADDSRDKLKWKAAAGPSLRA